MRRAVVVVTLGCALLSSLSMWWSMVAATALAGLFCKTLPRALALGFASSFLLWAGWPLILHVTGDGVLAPRLGSHLPWWPLVFICSGLVGGVLGLCSCWFGYALKQFILPNLGRRKL